MNFQRKEIDVLDTVDIVNLIPEIGMESIRNEIFEGLHRTDKYISSKFFYNDKGSLLFEKITQLKEYYPTRTEISILKRIAPNLLHNCNKLNIIELGSGDCSKISILLDAIPNESLHNISYSPVDVSILALEKSTEILMNRYPELNIHAYAADFFDELDFIPPLGQRLLCFFGSTIGNLLRSDAELMMKRISAAMRKGDRLLLGMDLVKDALVLHAAYNDAEGVTAAFNKNIINTVNEIIGTSFDVENFKHKAFYNEERARIEMHLIAEEDMKQQSPYSTKVISIHKGEIIHTENSHKYTYNDIKHFAKISGLTLKSIHTDKNNWFGLSEFVME